jgi:hypothetical protein
MNAFASAFVSNFLDPVFLSAAVITALVVKGWKFAWAFPVVGVALPLVFGAIGGHPPDAIHHAAAIAAMSLIGLFAMLGREYLGSGFAKG